MSTKKNEVISNMWKKLRGTQQSSHLKIPSTADATATQSIRNTLSEGIAQLVSGGTATAKI